MELATSPVSKPIRILLVDDHRVVRAGLRLLIEGRAGLEIVGEAGEGKDAITIAGREQPDIILLDLILGDKNGLDYVPALFAASTHARIIILTCLHDTELRQRAVQLGAMGLLVKEQTAEVLIKAIEKVYAGEAWVDRTTMAGLISELSRPGKTNGHNSEASKIDTLTKRERDIIRFVAQGLKNKQVASLLCISSITVRHHLTAVFSKLEMNDRFELIVFAHKHNLCDSWN